MFLKIRFCMLKSFRKVNFSTGFQRSIAKDHKLREQKYFFHAATVIKIGKMMLLGRLWLFQYLSHPHFRPNKLMLRPSAFSRKKEIQNRITNGLAMVFTREGLLSLSCLKICSHCARAIFEAHFQDLLDLLCLKIETFCIKHHI